MTERRTDGTSAFNTRTVGRDVSSFLIQQGGEDKLMKIQQHDGVVVEVAGSRQGFAKLLREGEVLQGEGEAPGAVVQLPSLPPTIYRPPGGGGAGPGTHLHVGGGGQGGRGVASPPSQVGRPPPLGFPTLGAGGGPWGGAPAHEGLVPFPLQPMGPSGIGGPTRWTPWTLPVVPVQYR